MKKFYSKQVMEHFVNPKHLGELKNPSGIGDTVNLACGDTMKVYIKVEENRIAKISFQTLGCATAIACSDMLCDLANGKTIEQAKKVSFKDIADKLGELPVQKVHCAHLAEKALKLAIQDFEINNENHSR